MLIINYWLLAWVINAKIETSRKFVPKSLVSDNRVRPIQPVTRVGVSEGPGPEPESWGWCWGPWRCLVGKVSGVSPLGLMTSTEKCLPGVSECIRVEESPVSCYLSASGRTPHRNWSLGSVVKMGKNTERTEVPRRQLSWCPGGYIRGRVRVGRTHSPCELESSWRGSLYGWRRVSHVLLSRQGVPINLRSWALDPQTWVWIPTLLHGLELILEAFPASFSSVVHWC